MADTSTIILTAGVTLLGGTLLFCVNSLLQKFLLEPVFALRKTIGDVSYCLQYHAWVFHQSAATMQGEEAKRFHEVFEELRSITAKMRAEAASVVGYNFFAKFKIIPSYPNLIEASGRLIRISNNLGYEHWDEMHDDLAEVGRRLSIDIGRPRYLQKRES